MDLGNDEQTSPPSTIVDPQLQKAAQEFSIPLSARLIYNLLVMFLLEEEGLLDHFMVQRLYPGTSKIAALFRTESNATVARLALRQTTWLGKFCVALRLYGRGDAADHDVAMHLRKISDSPLK